MDTIDETNISVNQAVGTTSTEVDQQTSATPAADEDNMMTDVEIGIVKDNPIERKGCSLRWSRLIKQVEVREATSGLLRSSIAAPTLDSAASFRKKNGPVTKTILNEVSGSAKPGELLALMGPSGSGKTSLLNVLSGRGAYQSGILSINGEQLTTQTMKRLKADVAYVKQSDVFFNHLTVRDQLTYTALLRLPGDRNVSSKHAEVERIIGLLRLKKCANSPIMTISGGEKKRVNIGTELLTDPSVIMLDEPTSGLDSTSAVALLKMLHNLAARDGKTVVTSIHQPSSAVFRSFDRLMMLADGCVVYFGTPEASMVYLNDLGMQCPGGYNAADHWMDLLVVDSAIEDDDDDYDLDQGETEHTAGESFDSSSNIAANGTEGTTIRKRGGAGLLRKQRLAAEAKRKESPRQRLIECWDNESIARQNDQAMTDTDNTSDGSTTPGSVGADVVAVVAESKYRTNWFTQFKVLTHRCLKNSRSAIFTPVNLIKSALIGLVTGLLWFQMDYTEKTVSDHSSYYFFTMTYWVFDSMFNALMAFPSEREVLFKERASGSYRLSAYFMAKTTSEAPTRLSLPFIYMVISYWMAGLNPKFVVFLGSTGCTLLSVMAGESIGLFIGASVMNFENSLAIMTVFALALMLVGGFFVQNVPSFITWLKYLSPFKFAFDASQQLVFDRPVPCDGSGALEGLCQGSDEGYATPEDVIDFLGVQGSVAFNVCMLCLMFIVPRFGAYVALKGKKGEERS